MIPKFTMANTTKSGRIERGSKNVQRTSRRMAKASRADGNNDAMFRHTILCRWRVCSCLVVACFMSVGCGAISIQPSCPAQLEVGASGTVWANELNAGATPRYRWEAIPVDAGTFENPDAPVTTFHAVREGEVILRLHAADGLFQAISDCLTVIGSGVELQVNLAALPGTVAVGDSVALICQVADDAETDSLVITQRSGPTVVFSFVETGLSGFVASEPGEFTFQCVGSTGGNTSESNTVTVTVTSSSGTTDPPSRPGRG